MEQKFSNKTVLITGGASGIGLATAQAFHKEGANVIITEKDPVKLKHAQESLANNREKGKILALQSDAGKISDITLLMKKVKENFQQLDVLFLNAGITAEPKELMRWTEADFDELVNINFKGVYFATQQAVPLLSNKSSVIITTSIANRFGSKNLSIYAACKAALHSLVKSLSLELIDKGISVNSVSPGPVDTPLLRNARALTEKQLKEIALLLPSQRFCKPEEIAEAVLFLASDKASYIVGHEFVIDGGISNKCII